MWRDLTWTKDGGFYLAGGTALALQIGHRRSIDFDFYHQGDFELAMVTQRLGEVGKECKVVTPSSWTTIGRVDGVETSFFKYSYGLIGDLVEADGIMLASVKDIAAMKCVAIVQRGTKRDFVDMYFLDKMFGLKKIFRWVAKKYPMYDVYHVKTALIYFEEAEREVMPEMLVDCDWGEVKRRLERAVLK